jgi:predicted component of type VI protein secretion system
MSDETTKVTQPSDEVATAKASTAKTSSMDELMEKHNQMIQFVKNTISTIETDLKRMRLVLNKLSNFDPKDLTSLDDKELAETIGTEELKSYTEDNIQVVE